MTSRALFELLGDHYGDGSLDSQRIAAKLLPEPLPGVELRVPTAVRDFDHQRRRKRIPDENVRASSAFGESLQTLVLDHIHIFLAPRWLPPADGLGQSDVECLFIDLGLALQQSALLRPNAEPLACPQLPALGNGFRPIAAPEPHGPDEPKLRQRTRPGRRTAACWLACKPAQRTLGLFCGHLLNPPIISLSSQRRVCSRHPRGEPRRSSRLGLRQGSARRGPPGPPP